MAVVISAGRVLNPSAFKFALNRELRSRISPYTALITFQIRSKGAIAKEVADNLLPITRELEYLGNLETELLALVLKNTNLHSAGKAVSRYAANLQKCKLSKSCKIFIGLAIYPFNGTSVDELINFALDHKAEKVCCQSPK